MAAQVGTLDQVQWHEGMLLSPQHFQAQDARVNELMHYYASQINPQAYGISTFKIDEEFLTEGRLRILEISGIMPDGLTFSFNAAEEQVELEQDLNDWDMDQLEKPTDDIWVHIGVTKTMDNASLVQGENPRFKSFENYNVVDINTGERLTTVPKLRPNIQLVIGELPTFMTGIPLMRLVNEDGVFKPQPFQPPTAHFPVDSELGKEVDHLMGQIRQKINFLTQRIFNHARTIASEDAEEAIKTLAAGILMVEGDFKSKVAHPFSIYKGLLNLAGHAWSLDPSHTLPAFDSYDHENMRDSFMPVLIFIRSMLDRIQEGYTILTLAQKGRQFHLYMDPEWLKVEKLIIGVRANHKMSMAELSDWLTTAVVASDSRVSHARENRILGADRKLITGVQEMKLFPPRGMILAEVNLEGNYIKGDEDLLIFNVEDNEEKRPNEIVFYLPKEKKDD